MMTFNDKKGYSEFEWEVKAAKNGTPTLLFGGRAIHSQYNPQGEAKAIAGKIIRQAREDGADHIIMLGMGLGYIPAAIYDAGWQKLIVWDPFPVMQREFPALDGNWRQCVTITQFFRDFEPQIRKHMKAGAKPKVVCHQNYDIYTGYEYRMLLDYLSKIYSPKEKKTVSSERSLQTLVRLPERGTIKPFENHFTDGLAIAVAPGPSLKEYLPLLKKRSGIKLFAPVQAAPMLQQENIHVDFIVSADPENMMSFFKDVQDDFGMLLAELASHPSTLDWKPERTALFALESDQLYDALWKSGQLPVFDLHGATVSELMVALAQYMGFSKILCLGMDMCWREERYHGYRSPNEYDRRNLTIESCFKLLDISDTVVSTQLSYFHACRCLTDFVSRPGNTGISYYQNAAGLDKGMRTVQPREIILLLSDNAGQYEMPADGNSHMFTVPEIKSLLDRTVSGHTARLQNGYQSGKTPVFKPKKELDALPDADLKNSIDRYRSMLSC